MVGLPLREPRVDGGLALHRLPQVAPVLAQPQLGRVLGVRVEVVPAALLLGEWQLLAGDVTRRCRTRLLR